MLHKCLLLTHSNAFPFLRYFLVLVIRSALYFLMARAAIAAIGLQMLGNKTDVITNSKL